MTFRCADVSVKSHAVLRHAQTCQMSLKDTVDTADASECHPLLVAVVVTFHQLEFENQCIYRPVMASYTYT